MKQFLDFLPLVVFFAFYKLYDIYAATTALIVATAVVLIYSWVRYRKVEKNGADHLRAGGRLRRVNHLLP
ncbi:Intracellular septation protein IspA [Klebsiella pneumoniae IS46]|uniref:Intracellular septation protein IspA n=2 Tax=Klebsiella pneumoniae TaxID=573 RepID=A0A3S4GGU0_KLEPN|nr:Intracellular septation protein IspA [Klebsiella pneumoniae IS43]CDL17275.1 Intracellular septation protein IspA [Klebsiella pneumoniae IS46]CDL51760.1 Intracellular septation protein IspA [Klebsiella pneumoniae ISC21]CDL63120.1 Intracellular septation protein IspA [Klebsiella pneumoniae IS39]VEA99997.1 intracellular septation protein IspA [Klebsiella pneumoniae]